jgi:multidrug efflux pump subunit AcrA (membrane-fusion protein)
MTGVVTERKRSPGEHVYEQTPILTIAEINPLNVEIVINAEQYKLFKVGMTAEVLPSAPVGGSYTARVDVFDPVIDPGSNTFRVRLVLPKPRKCHPGGTALLRPAAHRCALMKAAARAAPSGRPKTARVGTSVVLVKRG